MVAADSFSKLPSFFKSKRLFAAAVFILSKLFHFGFLEGTAAKKPFALVAVDE